MMENNKQLDPAPVLTVLLQGGVHGAGLHQPDKGKRIQCGCEGNLQEESVQGWAGRAVGYSRDSLMGSGRFSAKVTLVSYVGMKLAGWVVCE